MERRHEAFEECRLAGNEPRIEEREQELRIVGFELFEVRELPHLVSEHEMQIPERVEQTANEPFVGRSDRAVHEHEQVDVGVQTEMAPAVTAERDERNRPLRSRRLGEGALQYAVERE